MREIRSYGSVRGVVGNRYPYRDLPVFRFRVCAGDAISISVECSSRRDWATCSTFVSS